MERVGLVYLEIHWPVSLSLPTLFSGFRGKPESIMSLLSCSNFTFERAGRKCVQVGHGEPRGQLQLGCFSHFSSAPLSLPSFLPWDV